MNKKDIVKNIVYIFSIIGTIYTTIDYKITKINENEKRINENVKYLNNDAYSFMMKQKEKIGTKDVKVMDKLKIDYVCNKYKTMDIRILKACSSYEEKMLFYNKNK